MLKSDNLGMLKLYSTEALLKDLFTRKDFQKYANYNVGYLDRLELSIPLEKFEGADA